MRTGTGSLVLGAAGAAAVAGAFRPLVRRWPWSAVGALPSAFASESPAFVMAAQALAAGAGLRAGGPLGLGGTALGLAGLAGAAVLAGDARRSAGVLDEALRQVGVDPWEQPLHGGRGGVLPGPLARRRYRRVAHLSYSEHGPFGTLDVWHRTDLRPGGDAGRASIDRARAREERNEPGIDRQHGRAPVLLQVHGGAWTMGDKHGQGEPLMGYLAERGWVCVTLNYRLAPAHRWPAMIVDVKRAIAWIREHIAGHGGDPEWIAITGGSAGGHLAALAALSPNDPDFQPGFTEVDTTLRAAVPLYGVFDFTRDQQGLWPLLEGKLIGTRYAEDGQTWRQASPVLRIGPHAPPFLVVHGSADAVVGVNQSRRFVEALRAGSPAPVGYAELPRAQHGFDALPTARTARTVAAVHRFLTAVHAGGRATTRAVTGPGSLASSL